ncbi:hypothetical protein NDU88_005210 [Pleurodeles waltl]|uniref:Uncharacterized protein n=1 Tax=Pleurodeles waltl TaxID=8319 RepID=A0AAV7VMV9_PLEWA|nr:hypothetical protein NDU88_005210 [Pleurodeles waltl]
MPKTGRAPSRGPDTSPQQQTRSGTKAYRATVATAVEDTLFLKCDPRLFDRYPGGTKERRENETTSVDPDIRITTTNTEKGLGNQTPDGTGERRRDTGPEPVRDKDVEGKTEIKLTKDRCRKMT